MDSYLDRHKLAAQLARDTRNGLTAHPKSLPPKYRFDAHGSALFAEIMRQPEYYLTGAERQILAAHSDEIATTTGAQTVVDLGSGTSEKTRVLLAALRDHGTLVRFVPFDVDPAVLTQAGAVVAAEFPGIAVEPVFGDLDQHLDSLPRHPCRLLTCLGTTIGTFPGPQRRSLLASIRAALDDGDALLIGVDLVKSPARLVAAYDDAAGVTAAFDKNMLTVLNREVGGEFDLATFEHIATWNAELERVDMGLRCLIDQQVSINALDLVVYFSAGEYLHSASSTKFRRAGLKRELAAVGLRMTHWWVNDAGEYALSLSVPG